jgi:hypothetical protein
VTKVHKYKNSKTAYVSNGKMQSYGVLAGAVYESLKKVEAKTVTFSEAFSIFQEW